eukprot:gene13808-15253_t
MLVGEFQSDEDTVTTPSDHRTDINNITSELHQNRSIVFNAIIVSIPSKDKPHQLHEIVMEHDVMLDDYSFMPFLKRLLTRIGFARQRRFTDIMRQSVTNRRRHAKLAGYVFTYQKPSTMHLSQAIYETITSCHHLKKSIRRLKPIFSMLIRGGRQQAKLLLRKFSTKLPVKRCRAILTVHSEEPFYPRGRTPRSKRTEAAKTRVRAL